MRTLCPVRMLDYTRAQRIPATADKLARRELRKLTSWPSAASSPARTDTMTQVTTQSATHDDPDNARVSQGTIAPSLQPPGAGPLHRQGGNTAEKRKETHCHCAAPPHQEALPKHHASAFENESRSLYSCCCQKFPIGASCPAVQELRKGHPEGRDGDKAAGCEGSGRKRNVRELLGRTFFTIFCSSIRKARTILRGKAEAPEPSASLGSS